jgi:hypothetical protein
MGKKTSNVQLGRRDDAEIKKMLAKFAYEEYAAKKPIELRLIQIKPQTIMQKGSVLPNLLIKALRGAAYTIFLDYGEDIRFYFFDGNGQSMGASTFPKTEKMLKEMHGKGNSLLKLPKPDPLAHLDVESMELRKRFEKLAQRIAQRYHLPLPDLPPIQAGHFNLIAPKWQYGTLYPPENPTHIHFDTKKIDPPLQELIQLRELFILFLKIPDFDPRIALTWSNYEIFHFLGTIWACTLVDGQIAVAMLEKSVSFHSSEITLTKATEWVEKAFLPSIKKNPSQLADLSSLIHCFRIIYKFNLFQNPEILSLVLLWFLKHGIKRLKFFNRLKDTGIEEAWIFKEILGFVFGEQGLWKNYQIDLNGILNAHESYPLFLFSNAQLSTVTIPEYVWDLEQTSTSLPPEYKVKFQSEMKIILQGEISPIFMQIQRSIQIQYSDLFSRVLQSLLLSKFYTVNAPEKIHTTLGNDIHFEISISNTSDWILYDPRFELIAAPETRFMLQIIDQPRAVVFDRTWKIRAKLMPMKIGAGLIRLRVECRHPFIEEKRMMFSLLTIPTEIEN